MCSAAREIAEIEIYDVYGRRKYLTPGERQRFKKSVQALPLPERSFCLMHYYTGLRISEALELTFARIDVAEGLIIIRTLKRRKKRVFRAFPLPREYLRKLKRMQETAAPQSRIWPFSRKTGYRIVKRVMEQAKISGIHASPKGLRHGFGVVCVQEKVPLATISKWMGHSSERTTAIYLNVTGHEERILAQRVW